MYIKIGDEFLDNNFYFLTEILDVIDSRIEKIMNEIQTSADPDSNGLFDEGEYFIGVGFSLIQQYMSSTYPSLGINKDDALQLGAKITDQLSYIKAINAGANYWKHQSEWGLVNLITRDISKLSGNAKSTINTVELLTPWAEYTCSNLLAELTREDSFTLSSLLPYVKQWRIDLDTFFSKNKCIE